MTMPTIPFIKKRIGQAYLVCLQNSNQYIQLEEPAWFVFRKLASRCKTETIAKIFAIHNGIGYEESLILVKDIRSHIDIVNRADNSQKSIDRASENLKKHLILYQTL